MKVKDRNSNFNTENFARTKNKREWQGKLYWTKEESILNLGKNLKKIFPNIKVYTTAYVDKHSVHLVVKFKCEADEAEFILKQDNICICFEE
jgi:hypothetical protein